MDQSPLRPGRTRSLGVAILSAGLVLLLAAPAAGWSKGWTQPKRIFGAPGSPTHRMVTDGDGKVHVAAEKGSGGIWYITNAGGTWVNCQVSTGNDRQPGIAVEGGVVHISFARLTDGQDGLYTASSDQDGEGGCGWGETLRYSGKVTHTDLGIWGGQLHVAFRTGDKKLRYARGAASNPSWTLYEVIDSSCCTSPVVLELTTSGSPRVAYGDGGKKAQGLKYGVRTGKGWKASKAFGGRVKHVEMALDRTPGLFAWDKPSNAPRIVFVAKGKGTHVVRKGKSGVGGKWEHEYLGKYSMPPTTTTHSNRTWTVYGKGGKLWFQYRTAIPQAGTLSGSGREGKPQISGSQLTFTRNKGATGIYYSRAK